MYSNRDLIKRFRRGKSSGHACNMEIKELEIEGEDRGTILRGYEWAVYAHRTPNGKKITVFDDWYGYSVTTSKHINYVRGISNNKIEGKRPTTRKNRAYRSDDLVDIHEWKNVPFDSELEREVMVNGS